MPPFDLILFAHGLDTTLKIVGAPDWTRRERFDITATRPVNTTPEENAAMRSLLAERFG